MGKNGDDEATPLRQRRQRADDRPQERRHCLRLFRGQEKHPPRPANYRRSLRQAFERADRKEITASPAGARYIVPQCRIPVPSEVEGILRPARRVGRNAENLLLALLCSHCIQNFPPLLFVPSLAAWTDALSLLVFSNYYGFLRHL